MHQQSSCLSLPRKKATYMYFHACCHLHFLNGMCGLCDVIPSQDVNYYKQFFNSDLSVCVHLHMCVHEYVYVHVHVCVMCICVYVCVVSVHVCECLCMCTYACIIHADMIASAWKREENLGCRFLRHHLPFSFLSFSIFFFFLCLFLSLFFLFFSVKNFHWS